MNIAVALFPVMVLLLLLQLMDTFKLVRPASVAAAIAAGAGAAFAALAANDAIANDVAPAVLTRYVAPLTEEACKAAFIAMLLWRSRIGFLVDAAVLGFSVGAGFALVENIDYLRHLGDPRLAVWLVRGFGTGVLHASTTAVFAIVSKTLADGHGGKAWSLLPGLALAVALHSAFNHVVLPPLAMTALLLAILPLVVLLVFQRSEDAMREWVGAGLDLDIALLDLMRSDAFAATRFGGYLQELRRRFRGPIIADMFCLLRLELELSIQAKAMLMARDAGMTMPATADLRAGLREVAYLHESIGRAGLLALRPLHLANERDRWLRHLLAGDSRQ